MRSRVSTATSSTSTWTCVTTIPGSSSCSGSAPSTRCWFEDAELVARELGLKLTERPSGGSAPPVSQCGFAHHALDTFLPRLLSRGYRVAVCEESEEEPAEPGGRSAGSGGIRQRDVVRTLTPGHRHRSAPAPRGPPDLPGRHRAARRSAGAGLDGRGGRRVQGRRAGPGRGRRRASAPGAGRGDRLGGPAGAGCCWSRGGRSRPVGPSENAVGRLQRAFPEADLSSLPAAEIAAGLIVGYLEETQGAEVPVLDAPTPATPDEVMRLDAVTQRHLELVETERTRERAGSLLGTLDRTVTPMGRRMLRSWLLRPLVNPRTIVVRQQIVAELVADAALAGRPGRAPRGRGRPGAAGRPGQRAPGQPGRLAGARRGGCRAAGAGARDGRLRERRSCERSAGPARPWPSSRSGPGPP